jgi:hypothetical protein
MRWSVFWGPHRAFYTACYPISLDRPRCRCWWQDPIAEREATQDLPDDGSSSENYWEAVAANRENKARRIACRCCACSTRSSEVFANGVSRRRASPSSLETQEESSGARIVLRPAAGLLFRTRLADAYLRHDQHLGDGK